MTLVFARSNTIFAWYFFPLLTFSLQYRITHTHTPTHTERERHTDEESFVEPDRSSISRYTEAKLEMRVASSSMSEKRNRNARS